MKFKPNCVSDIIPVDTVANALILIAWRTAQQTQPSKDPVPIYNITTGNLNPTTWEEFLNYGREIAMKMPSIRMVRIPATVISGDGINVFYHNMIKLFSETLFAYLLDFIIIILGHKPM